MTNWMMPPDTAQGVGIELEFLLKDGWDLLREPNGFRITAHAGTLDIEHRKQKLNDEVWRIARFVAYAYFVSISRNEDGSYTIFSKRSPKEGFEIVVEAKN
jgi:hypothetical protein